MNKLSMRPRLGTKFAGAALAILPSQAFAQQAEDEATQTAVFTGIRISSPSDFGNSSPVDVIDRSSIEKAGYANLQQLMEKLPANGNGAFSTRGNNQDSTANGAASISLRGLGADATLALVNGRRVAISAFAERITTNFAAIERVDNALDESPPFAVGDGNNDLYGYVQGIHDPRGRFWSARAVFSF